MHRVKEARADYVFETIPGDVRKNVIILFIAELCSKVIRQTERNVPLFQMIEETVCTLDRSHKQIADTHLFFMIRLADLMGFGPEEKESSTIPYFDLLDGRFVSSIPEHHYYSDASELLNQYLIAARKSDAKNVTNDRIIRNQMLDTLLLYYQLHIDKMPEIYGHKVLREIL